MNPTYRVLPIINEQIKITIHKYYLLQVYPGLVHLFNYPTISYNLYRKPPLDL